MTKTFHFDTTIDYTDTSGEHEDVDVTVEVDYTAGRPGRNYLRNGDPGYPPEPAELEILVITDGDKVIPFDSLSEAMQDRIREKGYEAVED